MVTINRIIGILVATGIILSTLTFAFGLSPDGFEQMYSFGLSGLIVKTVLTAGLLIVTFFARPRWIVHRLIIGAVASIVIVFAGYGAFIGHLPNGDAVFYAVGAMLLAIETTEARLPQTKTPQRIQIPVVKLN